MHLSYTKLYFFRLSVLIHETCFVEMGAIIDFDPLYNFKMTFDLHNTIILHNSQTKYRRCMKLHIFRILMTRQTKQFDTIFREIGALTHKVNCSHLGNTTICGISDKCCLCFAFTLYQILDFYQTPHNHGNFLCLAALVFEMKRSLKQ